MRANTTIVVDLSVPLAKLINGIDLATAHLHDRVVWQVRTTEPDLRNGTPAQFSLTIGGTIEPEETDET